MAQMNTPTNVTKRPRDSPGHETSYKRNDYESLLKSFREIMIEELDNRLANLATKSDVDGINTKIAFLQKNNEVLTNQLNTHQKSIEENEKRWSNLDRNQRMKNVIFKNVPATTNIVSQIHNLLQQDLETSDYILCKVSQLSSRNDKVTLLAEFASATTATSVLMNSIKLKPKSIFLEKDLNTEQRSRKISLLKIRKSIFEKSKNSKVSVYENKILINGTKFTFNPKTREFTSADKVNLRDHLMENFDLITDKDYSGCSSQQ